MLFVKEENGRFYEKYFNKKKEKKKDKMISFDLIF